MSMISQSSARDAGRTSTPPSRRRTARSMRRRAFGGVRTRPATFGGGDAGAQIRADDDEIAFPGGVGGILQVLQRAAAAIVVEMRAGRVRRDLGLALSTSMTMCPRAPRGPWLSRPTRTVSPGSVWATCITIAEVETGDAVAGTAEMIDLDLGLRISCSVGGRVAPDSAVLVFSRMADLRPVGAARQRHEGGDVVAETLDRGAEIFVSAAIIASSDRDFGGVRSAAPAGGSLRREGLGGSGGRRPAVQGGRFRLSGRRRAVRLLGAGFGLAAAGATRLGGLFGGCHPSSWHAVCRFRPCRLAALPPRPRRLRLSPSAHSTTSRPGTTMRAIGPAVSFSMASMASLSSGEHSVKAWPLSPARPVAADAVHVILGVVRHVEIEHVAQARRCRCRGRRRRCRPAGATRSA